MKYLLVLFFALLAFSSVNARPTNNVECTFCGFIVNYVEGQIQNNQTETFILGELEKVCKFVPETLQATCDSLIMVYGEQLIQNVIAKENSTVICERIGMCPTLIKNVGTAKCTICEFVVGEVEKYVSGNATEAQIINFLNKDCKIFGSFETTCQALVQQYVPEIVQLLENKQPANTVCGEIKLCTSEETITKKVTGAVSCTICDAIVGEVEKLVASNSTESQITAAIEQVCNQLPGSFLQQTCNGLVSEYLPAIIQYVEQKQSATVICTEIGLCGNHNNSSEQGSSSDAPSSSSSGSASGSASGSGSQTGAASGTSGASSSGSGSSMSGSGSSMRITIQ